ARLAGLPEQTKVYCGHECTLANLRFAHDVDPNNTGLLAPAKDQQHKDEHGTPTVPSTTALEKTTNPFLRLLERDIVDAIRVHTRAAVSTPSASFEALRNWNNKF